MKINKKTIKYLPILILAVSFFAFNAKATVVTKQEIIDLVNQERKAAGLNELVESPVLDDAASLKAQDLIGNNYFAHTSPSGIDPWHWFEKVNYEYKYAGENLAMDFNSALSVHKAWMKSPTHKDNIVSDKYQEIGVAVLSGVMEDRETQVAVQLFGTQISDFAGFQNKEEEKKETEFSEEELEKMKEAIDSVKIIDASLSPWQGSFEDEMLVYSEIQGEPSKVEVVIEGEAYELEKLRENIYMNLISLNDIDLEKDDVVLKTSIDEKQAILYQIPKDNFQEYLASKDKEEKDNMVPAGVVGSVNNTDDTLAKWEYIFKQNILLIIITGVFLVTIINIWILEKEEENLLKSIKSA